MTILWEILMKSYTVDETTSVIKLDCFFWKIYLFSLLMSMIHLEFALDLLYWSVSIGFSTGIYFMKFSLLDQSLSSTLNENHN